MNCKTGMMFAAIAGALSYFWDKSEESFRPCSHVAAMQPCSLHSKTLSEEISKYQRKLDCQRLAALTPNSLPMTNEDMNGGGASSSG